MTSTHIVLSCPFPLICPAHFFALEREVIIAFSLVGISSFAIRNGGRKKRIRKREERKVRGEKKEEGRKGLGWQQRKRN